MKGMRLLGEIVEPRAGREKMSLEHLVIIENKKSVQKLIKGHEKDTGGNMKKLPIVKTGTN